MYRTRLIRAKVVSNHAPSDLFIGMFVITVVAVVREVSTSVALDVAISDRRATRRRARPAETVFTRPAGEVSDHLDVRLRRNAECAGSAAAHVRGHDGSGGRQCSRRCRG